MGGGRVNSNEGAKMDEKRIAEIKARAEAASKGPWNSHWSSPRANPNDTDFIAHAREDVPALVAEVRRMRKALRSTK
mgnify:CR=1 FL=1